MIQIKSHSQYWARHMEQSHDSLLGWISKFQDLLVRLRYEGKPLLGKNLKNARETFKALKLEFFSHCEVEEKALFPFLGRHVPRLCRVIRMLESDHEDLKRHMDWIEKQFSKIASPKKIKFENYHQIIGEIRDAGNFIVHFVKSHLKVENSIIHEAMKRELHPEEEEILWEKMKHWCF